MVLLNDDGAVGLSMCDLLLVFNSNTWPKSDPFRDISFKIDLHIDLSSSLKSNVIVHWTLHTCFPINV